MVLEEKQVKNKDLFQMLTDDEIVERYTDIMENVFEDFPKVRSQYEKAVEKLQELWGKEKAGNIDELINARKRQVASDAVFAYSMGMKANLHHFKNPNVAFFLDTSDFGYVQEYVMNTMPKRMEAQKVIDKVLTMMSREEYETYYLPILEYFCCFDTIVPKYAHYVGYITANTILRLTEPGYTEDHHLTLRYRNMVKELLVSPA